MNIQQIISKIDKQAFYRGEYHVFYGSDVIDFFSDYSEAKGVPEKDFTSTDDIIELFRDYYGYVSEKADSACPVYYSQTAEWFSGNWSAVDEMIDEIDCDISKQGIMQTINQAFFFTYERDLCSAIECFTKDIFSDNDETETN